MKKQPHITEQTRKKLAMAFWELYAEKPVEKITVKEITDRAGYNRATFYIYYKDVYDLLERIENSILEEIRGLADHLMAAPQLDVMQYMGSILEMTQRFNGFMPLLLGSHGDPAFAEGLKAILSPLLDRFLFSDDLGESERLVLREFYLDGLLGAISVWVANPDTLSMQTFIGLVVNRGLGVDAGSESGADAAAAAEEDAEPATGAAGSAQ